MRTPPIRVLLVEDNPGDARLIQEMLKEHPQARFELIRVDRLSAAREVMEEPCQFGAVLLDLSLPDSRGLDTFRALRQTNSMIPIVVLTGLDDEGVAIQAVQEGAQDYLVKGQTDSRRLVHSLRYAQGRSQRQRRIEKALRDSEAELDLAHSIEDGLLPRESPRLAGFDIFGDCVSAGAVGGDLFQYLRLSDGTLGVAVADVTGHGVGPALLKVAVRSYLRALALTRHDPAEILTQANSLFVEDVTDGNNCTIFLAKIDPSRRILSYANAGHPPGVLFGHDGCVKHQMYSTGVPLGILPDADYSVEQPLTLEPGDIFVLLTDGMREARSPDSEFFGDCRVLEIIRANRESDSQQIVRSLFSSVHDFQGGGLRADDITVVVVKVIE